MLRFNLLVITVFLATIVYGQPINSKYLDTNSVSARIENGGTFFRNSNTNFPSYEIIKGENTFSINSSSFWFGALDSNSELHGSFTFFQGNSDIFTGPYSSNNSYSSPDYANKYLGKIWKVSKEEIIYHIDNYNNPNYVAPEGIEDWPGNGDVNLGVASDLAPFVDVDNDGVYDPYSGDYPCIKGDQAVYVILNDDAQPQEHASKNIGIEVHLMFYQFESNDFADSTTFINTKVFNRSGEDYTDFKTSIFVDASIGFPFEQFIGCDTTKNIGYAYKSDNYDDGWNSVDGYGNNPPAIGTMVLNDTMASFGHFYNHTFFQPWPITENTFWNFMNSKWSDGSNWVYGGTGVSSSTGATSQTTNYLFSGNPYLDEGWTEMNIDGNGTSNPDDESKMYFLTIESDTFEENDILEYDYAFIFSRVGDHLENVQGLIDLTDDVQQLYNDSISIMSCEVQGTGVMDSIPSPTESKKPYPMLFEITRLDGKGNMGLPVEISSSSEAQVLTNNEVDSVRYELGYGPIYVERTDTVNYEEGYYIIKVLDNDIDNSDWRIYRYDYQGGQILDSADASTSLIQGDTVYLNQYGLKITLHQNKYPCFDGSSSCHIVNKLALPISSELEFADNTKPWLTGIKNNLGFNPENWISTGNLHISHDIYNPSLGLYNPECYQQFNKDLNLEYSNLIGGIIAPSFFTRFGSTSGCGMKPIQVPTQTINPSVYSGVQNNHQATVYHPNIDIVFTQDTSKWTRCAVIELHDDSLTSVGHALPGLLRKSPSVDKTGDPDNSGTEGLSWFPGYAIDVETGRRLNIAFGENSTLTDDNGADMVWNPTKRLYDNSGNPVFGGQHEIYVFGGQWDDMPNYDEAEFIYNMLSSFSLNKYRAVYRNLSWVMRPILEDGFDLLETETRVKVRLNNEFDHYELSDENESRPMFGFRVGEYDRFLDVESHEVTENHELFLYPNPSNKELNIRWKNIKEGNIQIYSIEGKLIKEIESTNDSNQISIDVSEFNNGIYLIKKGKVTRKFIKG